MAIENKLLNYIKNQNFLEIQELYESVKRNRQELRKINEIIKNEFYSIVNKLPKLRKLFDWDENTKVYNAFLIATYLWKDRGLKTTQIRKFLDKFKTIRNKCKLNPENFDKNEVIAIRPILAYSAGRNMSQVLPLVKVLDPLILKIEKYDDFIEFYEFLESIVAFHKFLGGD